MNEQNLPQVKVIADTQIGIRRVTTLQLRYWRAIHSELLTHRVFSRNSSSSRAVPVSILSSADVILPYRWGKNQKGMQPSKENLSVEDAELAQELWVSAATKCLDAAKKLAELGVHKQWANRMLEWFTPIDTIITGTDWDNFLTQRCHPDAQDEMRLLAEAIRRELRESHPKEDKFHVPYVSVKLPSPLDTLKISAARCARVSHLKHDGTAPSEAEDLMLYRFLVKHRHASPLEHPRWYDGEWRTMREHEGI